MGSFKDWSLGCLQGERPWLCLGIDSSVCWEIEDLRSWTCLLPVLPDLGWRVTAQDLLPQTRPLVGRSQHVPWPISVALCDPMDCSTLGFPILHYLQEVAQIHAHQGSDAIQPSHPLLSPSPPAFNLSQHWGLFNESIFHIWWPKFGALASASILPVNVQG